MNARCRAHIGRRAAVGRLTSASSAAFSTMPVPFPALGVTMTFAPSMRISFRRSTEKGSAMVITHG